MLATSLRWYVADGEVHPVGDPTPASPPAPASACRAAPVPAASAQPPADGGGAPSSAQAWYSAEEEGEAGGGSSASQAAAAPAPGGPSAQTIGAGNGASADRPYYSNGALGNGRSHKGLGAASAGGSGAAGADAGPGRHGDRRASCAEQLYERHHAWHMYSRTCCKAKQL